LAIDYVILNGTKSPENYTVFNANTTYSNLRVIFLEQLLKIN